MVTLSSEITIGPYRFSGVNEVRINRTIHNYIDKATIKLPSIANLQQGQKKIQKATTGTLFSAGDVVTIRLGYDGKMNTEFEGFVSKCNLNMPLEVECEGYSRQLRLNNSITKYFKSTTVKELLQLAVSKTDITIEVQDDIKLENIKLTNDSGATICDKIKDACDQTIAIYFKSPKVLWAGLTYTAYATATGNDPLGAGNVKYRLGYDCIKDNSLKERTTKDNPTQVIFNTKTSGGQTYFSASQEKAAAKQIKKLLPHISIEKLLQQLAQEKEYQENYAGYEGKLTGFLQPFASPGFSSYITDTRYPNLDGSYLVESTEVTFGTQGARRICEIGPKAGFSKK